MRPGVKPTLACGLTLLLAGVALALSRAPVRTLATNGVPLSGVLATLHGPASLCQPELAPPPGASAVRLGLESAVGPHVRVTLSSLGRTLASGERGSGWMGADVTMPLRHAAHGTHEALLCVSLGAEPKSVLLVGAASSPRIAAASSEGSYGGRIAVEYLASASGSWWSRIPAIARRIGLGKAPGGGWAALIILALTLAAAALASTLAVRDLARRREPERRSGPPGAGTRAVRLRSALRRVPAAAWICAAVAVLNAAAWSLLTPPFQVIDEPSHFAYTQQLIEAHRLPHLPEGPGEGFEFSPEEQTALADLHQSEVQFLPSAPTISSPAQQRRLERDLARALPRRGSGYAGVAINQPPLYYALETIPYELGASGSLLDRLELMRLFSGLFAGVTALFGFLFVRETLPRVRWAWTVGGLSIALAPLLAFMSGGVNPDGMLFAVSAALFYLLARAFRRGLSPALAAGVCALVAVGLLTKLNFLGLVPGVLLGLALAVARSSPSSRRTVLRAAAALIAALGALIALAAAVGNATVSIVSADISHATTGANVLEELSYTWQLYLPRLPGMRSYFPGVFAPGQLWFDGLVGRYGWSDTFFPSWVDHAALVPTALVALLVVRALARASSALRGRAGELAVYATMAVGLLALVGFTSYGHGETFWEPRYLLPLLPLFGATLALAARGAGRCRGPAAGMAIVVLVLGHDVFSQLLMVSRYYA